MYTYIHTYICKGINNRKKANKNTKQNSAANNSKVKHRASRANEHS